MSTYAKRLGKRAFITPHIMVRQCRHCSGPDVNCNRYGNKIFCTPVIKGLKLAGAEALRQGLEELCIYDAYKSEDNAQVWWDYMLGTYDCKDMQGSEYTSCVSSAKDSAGVESSKLASCMSSSTATVEREFDLWLSSGIPYNPAIVVNNKVYRVCSDGI